MSAFTVTDGMTKPIRFVLKADGVALNLTGSSILLHMQGGNGVVIDTTGKVTVSSPQAGEVDFAPAAGDFVAAQFYVLAKFRVTDAAGKVDFYPRGKPIIGTVTPVLV